MHQNGEMWAVLAAPRALNTHQQPSMCPIEAPKTCAGQAAGGWFTQGGEHLM
jgi:hypothetical protein